MPNIFKPGKPSLVDVGKRFKGHPNAIKLAKQKGEWARVYISKNRKTAYVKASHIRTGKIKGYAIVGKFEALPPRPTPEGWVVWARCVSINPDFGGEVGIDGAADSHS